MVGLHSSGDLGETIKLIGSCAWGEGAEEVLDFGSHFMMRKTGEW